MPSIHSVALRLFFILCALLCAAPAHAAGPWRDVTVEQAKAQAATFFQEGKYKEAYALYMSLVREIPEDNAVNLGLARSAGKIGEYNQAVFFLERLTDKYPRNEALRLELIKACIQAGSLDAARREMALAREYNPSLAPELDDIIIQRLEDQLSRWQFSGSLSAGILYDSNVNQGPQSAFMQLGMWNLKLDAQATRKSSWGAYSSAFLNGGWRMGPESPWWLVGDAALYAKGYFNSLPTNRSMTWGRMALGLRRIGASTLFDLRLKTDAVDYMDDDQVARNNGSELQFIWAATPNIQLLTRAALERRDYQTGNGRQGWYMWAGEYVRLLWGKDNHSLLIGGRYINAECLRDDYGYEGWEGLSSMTLKLWKKTELTPFIAYRRERYNGPATALEMEKRRDENTRVGTSLTWQFTEAFSWDLTWQYTNNHSKSPLYTYDQHLISSGVTWKF